MVDIKGISLSLRGYEAEAIYYLCKRNQDDAPIRDVFQKLHEKIGATISKKLCTKNQRFLGDKIASN